MREDGDTKEKRYSVFYSYGRFFQGGFFSWLIPATTIVLLITKQILDIIQPRTRQNGGANEARIRRPSVTRSVAKNNETSREIAVVVAETDRPCARHATAATTGVTEQKGKTIVIQSLGKQTAYIHRKEERENGRKEESGSVKDSNSVFFKTKCGKIYIFSTEVTSNHINKCAIYPMQI